MREVNNVLVKIPVTEEEAEALRAAAPDAVFDFAAPVGETCRLPKTPKLEIAADRVAKADVILGNVAPSLIAASPRLQWIQLGSAGYEAYLTPGVLAPSTIVTNGTGAYGPAVAEHSFAMLLSLMKRLPAYRDNQRAHAWLDEGMVSGGCSCPGAGRRRHWPLFRTPLHGGWVYVRRGEKTCAEQPISKVCAGLRACGVHGRACARAAPGRCGRKLPTQLSRDARTCGRWVSRQHEDRCVSGERRPR